MKLMIVNGMVTVIAALAIGHRLLTISRQPVSGSSGCCPCAPCASGAPEMLAFRYFLEIVGQCAVVRSVP